MNIVYHLAQANVARTRAPLDDPIMHGFVSQLETINALADRSPGFVWRLKTDGGDATSIRAYDDDRILFNMSVWDSIDALRAYVYRSDHADALRARKDWFVSLGRPSLVLWWVPAGHTPTIDEAKEKLAMLEATGASAEAFTFADPFPPPVAAAPRRSLATTSTIIAVLLVVAGTIGCDRVTKHVAEETLTGLATQSYLADMVRLEYTRNAGAFLGLGADWPLLARIAVFMVGNGLLLVALVVAAVRLRWSGMALVGLAFFVAGGLSNLADRLTRGAVTDFINVGLGPLRTGIFNVADVAIIVGAALVVLARYRARDAS